MAREWYSWWTCGIQTWPQPRDRHWTTSSPLGAERELRGEKGQQFPFVLTVWDECKGKDRVLRTWVSSSSIRTFTLTFPIGTASVETSMYRHYCTLSVFTELFKSNHSKNLLVNCAWDDALAFILFLQFSCRVTFIPSECHSIISPKALTVNPTWKCTFCQAWSLQPGRIV